jgi:hypothetical protein
MSDDMYTSGTEYVEWKAVCHEDGCRGIEHGPYSKPKYARSDKNAHEKWHEQRGETANVEVVERIAEAGNEQAKEGSDDE